MENQTLLVAGTDRRDGVEVEIIVKHNGNLDMAKFILEALQTHESSTTEVGELDFVWEVTTLDIGEDEDILSYVVPQRAKSASMMLTREYSDREVMARPAKFSEVKEQLRFSATKPN